MKKQFFNISYVFLFAAVVLFSCKKENGPNGNNPDMEAKTHSDDEFRISGEIDALAADADVMLSAEASFSGRGERVESLICDASVVVNTTANPMTITITYNGTNCQGNRTRSGVMILSMAQGMKWKNAGAVVSITCQNLKITRVSDNKSITLNGTKTITNESGGLLLYLPTLNSITHLINSSGLSITFDNGAQRTWQIARKHVFTYNNGVVVSITGTHAANGINNISEWGTNRFGIAFTTATMEPVILRQDCNARITSGKVEHRTNNFTASSTFGLDASGNPADCPGTGAYYLKLVWQGPAGNSHSILLPY